MQVSCKDPQRAQQKCVDQLHQEGVQVKEAENGSLARGSTGGAMSRHRGITKDETKLITGEAVGPGGFHLEKLTAGIVYWRGGTFSN